MALPNTGITTSMVASAIGAATNDVGQLCSHPNVNKWSRWKPVSLAKVTGITENDLKSVNYGFTIPEFDKPYEVLNAILDGTTWVYNKPIGGSLSPYRIGDFRNYNHSATNWFIYTSDGTTDVEFGVNWKSTIAEDLQWIISNFSKFSFVFSGSTPISGALDLGLILRSTSSNPAAENCYYYKVCDWLDMDTEKPFNMELPDGSIPLGTYYIIPVLTNSTNFTSGTITYINQNSSIYGTWYLLPTNTITINIVEGGSTIINNISFELNYYDVDIDTLHYMVTVNSFVINIDNSNTSNIDVIVQFVMTDAVSGQIGDTIPVTLPAQQTIELELIRPSTYPNGLRYESAFNQPTAHVTLTYSESSIQQDINLFED